MGGKSGKIKGPSECARQRTEAAVEAMMDYNRRLSEDGVKNLRGLGTPRPLPRRERDS